MGGVGYFATKFALDFDHLCRCSLSESGPLPHNLCSNNRFGSIQWDAKSAGFASLFIHIYVDIILCETLSNSHYSNSEISDFPL